MKTAVKMITAIAFLALAVGGSALDSENLLVPVMIGCFVGLFAVAAALHLLYRLCDKLFLSKAEGLLAKLLQRLVFQKKP